MHIVNTFYALHVLYRSIIFVLVVSSEILLTRKNDLYRKNYVNPAVYDQCNGYPPY